jgi:N-acyl-D-aspartate/D-glutamate deacylase
VNPFNGALHAAGPATSAARVRKFRAAAGQVRARRARHPLEEAIQKLTSLPADTLRTKDRGRLATGQFADVVVFDPRAIADKATYEKPHQYSVGVRDVWVNGTQVLKDGEHTGAKPGRVVRGPG